TPEEEDAPTLFKLQNLQKTLKELLAWASENRQLFSLLALLLGALLLVNVAIALLTAVQTFPFLPEVLQVVGLGYSGWFVARKLIWAGQRQEVLQQWETLKTNILGDGIADTLLNYCPEPAEPPTTVREESPIASPTPTVPHLESNAVDELRYLFLASQVELIDSTDPLEALTHKLVTEEIGVGMVKAEGCKCDRCWNYSVFVGQFVNHPDLCERCIPIVETLLD
ncbi:MAG: CAAD domain-containing protein, partial [Prochlorotrichaceae cyanobacterium]